MRKLAPGEQEVKEDRLAGSVLVFNFFGGILTRGIALYVDNLCEGMKRSGIDARQFRCPKSLRRMPRPIVNILFVLAEQVLMPIVSIGHQRVIYASNSVSILGTLSKRTAIIVHDFIPNRKRNRSFAARYIRTTQRVHALLGRDVIFVSKSIERIARQAHIFPHSRKFEFPNSFYIFFEKRPRQVSVRQDHVLLCSGWGANKDLAGALRLYVNSGLYRLRPLRVLGLSGRTRIVDEFRGLYPEASKRITVLPSLTDDAVIQEYGSASWVWIHSRSEGYGRSIAEARFCGCSVVASRIAAFREQRDDFTFLYRDLEDFKDAVLHSERTAAAANFRYPEEHDRLEAELHKFLRG